MRKLLLGAIMGVMMMLIACGGAAVKTQTFASNTTWVAPAGVTNLLTASGKGKNGTPAVSGTWGYYEYLTSTTYDANGNVASQTGPSLIRTVYSTPAPANYTDTFSSGDGTTLKQQHTFTNFDNSKSATTGASATGFGKTFPGGVGGPATTTTFNNVAVTPGQSYALVIPSGATITITYYE